MSTLTEHTTWHMDIPRGPKSSVPGLSDGTVSEPLWYSCEHVGDHIDAVVRKVPGLSDALAHLCAKICMDGWRCVQ